MKPPTYRFDSDHGSEVEEVTIDMSDVNSLRSLPDIKLRNIDKAIVKEFHAGTIGRMAIWVLACFVIPLPVIGGLIAALGSIEQAQAFGSIVTQLLDSVSRFMMIFLWPVLVYYFTRNRNANNE